MVARMNRDPVAIDVPRHEFTMKSLRRVEMWSPNRSPGAELRTTSGRSRVTPGRHWPVLVYDVHLSRTLGVRRTLVKSHLPTTFESKGGRDGPASARRAPGPAQPRPRAARRHCAGRRSRDRVAEHAGARPGPWCCPDGPL